MPFFYASPLLRTATWPASVYATPSVLRLQPAQPGRSLVVGIDETLEKSMVLRELLIDLEFDAPQNSVKLFASLLVKSNSRPHENNPPQDIFFEVKEDWDAFPQNIGLVLGKDFLDGRSWDVYHHWDLSQNKQVLCMKSKRGPCRPYQ